jgi:ABC-2 type transport system permease protein
MRRNLMVIYVMWLRDMKRFVRAPSRIIGSLVIPFLLLVSLGLGFGKMAIPGVSAGTGYLGFLVPGMAAMTILFTGMFSGLSVLWDRQYGFLKEIMVAPVSRVSIVIGRIVSGATTGIIQTYLLIFVSIFIGFKLPSFLSLFIALIFMVLMAFIFTSIGLIFASRMKDEQGFGLIMNFLVFPLLLLSGAFVPMNNFPAWVKIVSLANPMTYGVDGLRNTLLGTSVIPLPVSLLVSGSIAVLLIIAGAWFFETSEIV